MPIKLSLVIPTYNEAENITCICQKLIEVSVALNIDYQIVVVDDDSPDLTWKVAEGLASQDSRIKVIRRMRSRGLAQAVVDGWKSCGGDLIGVIDGDLQHPAELLPAMVKRMIDYPDLDIVVASRYVSGGGISKNNFCQRVRSRSAIFLGHIFLHRIFKLVKDPMSGYFILRKEVIAGRKLAPIGYKILLEVLAIGNYRKVYEIPYLFSPRQKGQTKAGWKQCFLYLLYLVVLRIRLYAAALKSL